MPRLNPFARAAVKLTKLLGKPRSMIHVSA